MREVGPGLTEVTDYGADIVDMLLGGEDDDGDWEANAQILVDKIDLNLISMESTKLQVSGDTNKKTSRSPG